MKTNSSKRHKPFNKGSNFFNVLKPHFINRIARESEFIVRCDGKISPISFIGSFMRMVSKGFSSYASWASELSMELGISLSKQAIDERMNARTEKFVKSLFQYQFSTEIADNVKRKWAKKFANIYCEDSTHLNLPKELSSYYPGNISRGKEMAVVKLHALFNMTINCFAMLDIHSFRQNDQGLASVSRQYLQKGDLILRDLGFMALSCIQKFVEDGIYYLTRKQYSLKVYDPASDLEINLLKCVRKRGFFDQEVLVGKQRQKARMIVMPVSRQQAAQRRRKARQDRDKRFTHSAEYYSLLGFTIFLTNIESHKCTAGDAIELYGLRWRIEMIFKSWKSIFSFQQIIPSKCKNIYRINCIIYLMLIYILIFQKLYRHCLKKQPMEISPTKLSVFFRQHILILLQQNQFQIPNTLLKYCNYETRNDRQNAIQKFHKLAA